MFEEILFPTDGSEGATAAFDHVLDLAAAHDATVHLLNVADTTQDSVVRVGGEVVDVLEGEGEEIVAAAAERASERGVPTVTEVRQGEPYSTIVDYAATLDLDLVVLPTRGRQGLERLLLGSTTERVVRRSDVPVLTIRPEATPSYPYRNVLVPTDGSASARAALATAADLATADGAALHLLSVVDVGSVDPDVWAERQVELFEDNAEEFVEDAAASAREAGVESLATAVEYGTSIAGEIRSYVEDHEIDLVVVGTHGRTGFDRYVLGSVAEKLVRTSPVPVLTVREPDEDA